MYWLYSLLLASWGLLLLPVFLYKAWRYQKYLPGMGQRFGRLPEALKTDGCAVIWFHACSVGETLSLQPLINTLRQSLPHARFVVSTITKTGQEIATRQFGADNTFYFPIDFAFVIRRVLRWIQPSLIVIIDTEIWPNLIHQARRRRIPVMLANGRISPASLRYYLWARPVFRPALKKYASLMMQSPDDAERIIRIGAPAEIVSIPGNLKFDRDLIRKDSAETLQASLIANFGINKPGGFLIIAGSTHPGEEQMLLDVFQEIRRHPGLEQTRILFAPRHPERFNEVENLAIQASFAVRRRTQDASADSEAPVLLLDTLGELAEVYRFAAVVFIGGTLVRHGGHSILEPAAFSRPIVIGPSMENFRSIRDEFYAQNAIREITAGEENPALQKKQLLEVFLQLLQNSEERAALGNAAFAILEKNRGAARRISDRIIEVIKAADRAAKDSA